MHALNKVCCVTWKSLIEKEVVRLAYMHQNNFIPVSQNVIKFKYGTNCQYDKAQQNNQGGEVYKNFFDLVFLS